MSLSFPEPTSSEREEKTGGEMEQREVESSPVPSSHDMPEGFQQLIDHNNNEPTSSYPPPPQDQQQAPLPTVNMHGHINNTPQSGYSSPANQYRHPDMIYGQDVIHGASPYQYPENNYPSSYATEQSTYPPPPETATANQTPHQPYSTPATSPPTPSQQSDAMRTRSGKAIRAAQTPGGSHSYRADPYTNPSPKSKAARPSSGGSGPPPKKRKKAAKEDDAEFVMDKPLSVMCATMEGVQEIDIDAYANRSVETRRGEVANSKTGKTKRPSNAFMLYRKAYQNRAKELKKHDNHQIVSKVCGSSWKHEEEAVKRHFNELARIESELHRQAFPDYKFTPAKSNKHKEKKGNTPVPGYHYADDNRSLEEEDEFELGTGIIDSRAPPPHGLQYGGPDDEYRPPSSSQSGSYHDIYGYHNASPVMMQQQRLTPTPYHLQTPPPPAQLSSYEYNNPGRPKPLPYGTRVVQGPGGPYQQTTPEMMHQHPQQTTQQMYRPYMSPRQQQQPHPGMMPMQYGLPGVPLRVENVYVRRSDSPGPPYGVANSPVMGPPPPGGGGSDQFGGMVPQYGNPATMHHHAPPPQHHGIPPHAHHLTPTPPPHHQQQQMNPQNIDPSLMPLHAPQPYPDDGGGGGPNTPRMDALDGFFNPGGGGGEFHVDVDPADGMGYPPLPGDYDDDHMYRPTPQPPGTPSHYRDGSSEHGLSEFERYSLDDHGAGGMAPPGVEAGREDAAAGWTVEHLGAENPFDFDDLLNQHQEQDHFQDQDRDHADAGPEQDQKTPEKPSEEQHVQVDAASGGGDGADTVKAAL